MKKTSLLIFIGFISNFLFSPVFSAQKGDKKMSIELASSAFSDMQPIPAKYTCDGQDISPPLKWRGIPEKTKSIVLIVDDPDAPKGTWVHWVLYDIPPGVDSLSENQPGNDTLPSGAKQGITDFKRVGYGGPCPPGGTHRYFFKIYALDTMLNLSAGKTKKEIETAMKNHIITQGELVGTYTSKHK
jgi:Raf kinase inhibitor-like YbhB/YbcL family protein